MHLTLLADASGWHAKDLMRSARDRRWQVTAAEFQTLTGGEPRPATPPCPEKRQCVIVRTMPAGSLEQVIFRMDVLHAWIARGMAVFNPPRALETCIDKYLTTHRLAEAGLPVPRTWCGQRAEDALPAFAGLGGDVLVKPLFGSEGRGIVRVSDEPSAWRVFHAVERTGGVLYLQECIRHPGWDLRAFVVDKRVVAAMKRHGSGGWCTNVAQGASAEAVHLTPEEANLAIAAAQAVGCPIAGVDLLPGPDGLFVLEVNAVPGWRALAKACDIDVAAVILDFISGQMNG